ncbi:RNA-directed DNA polymerase [Paenalkalicoccus suaedae]|uniref:RNA-directed DNA polymerase n=1 Tax=Paenalkalicoccus suaedae TaxID=2592382 RepID=A0A859F9G3_9BACI|nr:RNA-directed DNA polymerase [Paenalkalicoccus suaedae]QKS69719.1 RNA-directed DNA polymerase [Paenalkalicoccus suaedae]
MNEHFFLRTDVLPEEIPIAFSNKNVYSNITKKYLRDVDIQAFIKNFKNRDTVPLFFYVPKNDSERRKIALVHPIAQIQMFNYIITYEQMITAFCKKSPFSVRAPIKRNLPKYRDLELKRKKYKKIEEEYNFLNEMSVTSDEDQTMFYNYFSYNKYKKITNLYNSVKFNRDKYKYNYFLKLDIQKCFPSIYTHSLSWALFGDKSIAKKYKNLEEAFPNATDKIAQIINFNETHGLIVGPEFSRVLAEMLLGKIDTMVFSIAKENNLVHHLDYKMYRFIDDYFLFAKNKKTIDLIENYLNSALMEFNLSLNVSKSELQERPFNISDNSIIILKKAFEGFNSQKLLSSILKKIDFTDYKGSRYEWNDLLYNMENMLSSIPQSNTRVINYFLKTIRSSIFFDGRHKHIIEHSIEVVSNIYSININYKSTNYLIAIYIKIFNAIKKIENEITLELSRLTFPLTKTEFIKIDEKKDSLIYLKEKMYQHLFIILKNNIENINYMYELIPFMRMLDKRMPASFLCEILDKNKSEYFISCSIGYYILEKEDSSLNSMYKTVAMKLYNVVEFNTKYYISKGAKEKIYESDYFYYLNDFAKYPGFSDKQRKTLNDRLISSFHQIISTGNDSDKKLKSEIWGFITQESYYNWNITYNTFIRKIVKKSSNLTNSNNDYD